MERHLGDNRLYYLSEQESLSMACFICKQLRTVTFANEIVIRSITTVGARLWPTNKVILDIMSGKPHVYQRGMWLTLVMPRGYNHGQIEVLMLMIGKTEAVRSKKNQEMDERTSTTGSRPH